MPQVDLPTGLRGAYEALSYGHDSRLAHDRLTTLVWLRLAADPSAPLVAGFNPRTMVTPKIEWPLPRDARLLDAGGTVLNMALGYDDLLSTDWHELPQPTLEKALDELERWDPHGFHMCDWLGDTSQRIRGDKNGLGEFYTPYHISLCMAMITDPAPGESVIDPCCGAGGMLLAALESCRNRHDGIPEVFGIDINPIAVRLCRMNLALAGVHPAQRVECRNALEAIPAEERTPIQDAMVKQLELFEYEPAA